MIEQEIELKEESPDEEQNEAWGAYWMDDLEIDATMMCTEALWGERILVDSKSESHALVPDLAVDSGAASNVVGRTWINSWRNGET